MFEVEAQAEADREMRARDAKASRKIREAKAQIELADIEAVMERKIDAGSLASSRRSQRTIREPGRSSIAESRAVRKYERARCVHPVANRAIRPALVASMQPREWCVPKVNYRSPVRAMSAPICRQNRRPDNMAVPAFEYVTHACHVTALLPPGN